MSKSLRILFLSVLAAAVAVMPAMGLTINEETTGFDNTYEYLNYEKHFTTDADDSSEVTWSLISTADVTASADATAWLKSAMSGDVFVVYGQLPEYSDVETDQDPNEYTYAVMATFSSETASKDFTVTVEEDTDTTSSEFTGGTISGDSINSADRDYSVVIAFTQDPDNNSALMASGDFDLYSFFTSLPYWLTVTCSTDSLVTDTDTGDTEDFITGLIITHKSGVDVEAGESGVVRFYDENSSDGVYVNWPVTFTETIVYNPSTSFDLTASGDTTVSVVLGTQNTSITLIPSNDIGTVTYSSDVSWVTVSDSGDVTIAPADERLARPAAHTVTITATDSARAADNTATVTLTITVTHFTMNVSSSDVSMDLNAQGGRVKTLKLSSDIALRYTCTVSPTTGLTVSIDQLPNVATTSATATLTATATGTYTVTFTATDSAGRTATKTTTVTVTDSSNPGSGSDFKLNLSETTLPLNLSTSGGNTGTITLSANGATSYSSSVSPDNGGLTVSINQSTGVATLTAMTAGTYTVTFTAKDAAGKTAMSKATITVSSGVIPGPTDESKDFSLAVTTSTVSLTLGTLGGYTKTVTLTAIDADGSVTYSSSVSPNNGGLTVTINQSTGVATLTAMTAGTYTVTFTATNAAGRTASAKTTVTVAGGILSPDIPSIDITPLSGSSGGCDAGFGVLALALAAPLFFRRKRS